jgi:hypothetical protein
LREQQIVPLKQRIIELGAAAALSHWVLISNAEAAAGKGFNNLAIIQVVQVAKKLEADMQWLNREKGWKGICWGGPNPLPLGVIS